MPNSSRPSGSSQGERPRRGATRSGSGTSTSASGRARPRQASLAGSPSGIRRQAGRRKGRPNLWPRRIITGTGLLLVVGLILWAVFNAVAWVFSDSDESVVQSGAQYAPLPEDGPRASSENLTRGHGVDGADYGSAAEMGERPLPQWDFSSAKVTIVDDSSEGGRNVTPRASLLAPDLPEGTLTGAVTDLPSATGMLDRVTMRPTATGMIPVVKRDTQHP